MHTVYISLGSNLGDRKKNLESALNLINESEFMQVLSCSKWLENPAIEDAGPEPFLNGVVKLYCNLEPHALLQELQKIESQIDSKREERGRKAARIIDIDILLFDKLFIDSVDLTIPHPRMFSRDFVLTPLSELEANIVQETVYSFFKLKPEYKIRRMMLSDLDQVCIIESDVYGEVHWTRDNFVSELDNPVGNYNVLCENDNEILGYIGSWMIVDEMHITTVATAKNHMRKGVAEALFINQIFKALENNVKALTLEVRISNVKAQGLYEKYGFQRQGIRKRYYEDTLESALIMWTEDINSETYQKNFRERLLELVRKSELFV
jgi:ribosomal-protein-alanine N-acetyltransferase